MTSPYDSIPGKIFIGGISPVTSQETIESYFSKYGDLSDCVLMQDKTTGKSRGFGFITYKDSRVVDDVLAKYHTIDSKEVDCKRAIPRDQQVELGKDEKQYKTKKLFVGGLPQATNENSFRDYFQQFGKVEDSIIMVDKETGKSRGFGFITFDNEDSVDRVINRYYDVKLDGKWVECKRAQPKELSNSHTKKSASKSQKDYDSSSPPNYGVSEGSPLEYQYSASSNSQGQQGQGGYNQTNLTMSPKIEKHNFSGMDPYGELYFQSIKIPGGYFSPSYTQNHNTQNEYFSHNSDMSYKKPHLVDPSLLQNHPSAISGLNHYDLYYQNRLDKTSGAGTQMGNPSINIQNSNVYLDFNIYTQAQFPNGQDPQKNPKSPTQTMDFSTAKSSSNQNFDFNNLLASFGKDQSSKNNIFVDSSKYNPSLNFYPQSMTMRDTSRFGEISVGSQELKEDSRWKQWQ